jgi:hypothetical protein
MGKRKRKFNRKAVVSSSPGLPLRVPWEDCYPT